MFRFDRPAVLVAPGTGIAPMRAFLYQREHLRSSSTHPAVAPVVAFFGFRHRTGDFLYAHELAELVHANEPVSLQMDQLDDTSQREGSGAEVMDPEAPARGNSNWPSSSSSSSSSHAVGPSQWPAVSGGLSIYTAFSRDGSGAGVVGCAGAAQGKEYVQTCIARKGKTVWRLLQDGGIVYLAGAAGAMPQDVVAAIGAVAREHGGLEEEQVEEWLLQLRAARRLQIECW